MQNHQEMNLVLSTDSKPRLKWSPKLHQRFVDAVNHLGGADKATPKSLMRVMGITGLTLYHLKSHLQKYRLGKSQQSESNVQIKLEEFKEKQRKDRNLNEENSHVSQDHNTNESIMISEALQNQLEVQKKLQEQIEVQKHLQLRIEAQGKYLQRILRNAQDTISGYGYCSEALEQAKAELSQLASMVNSGCRSSSLSELTESTELKVNGVDMDEIRVKRMCSIESSLTSEERPVMKKMRGREMEKEQEQEQEQEQSSSVFEGDFKNKSDVDHHKFGMGLQLIEFL